MPCLVGRKVEDGNGIGNENGCKGVKIKSRGKLDSDEKKFVALEKG